MPRGPPHAALRTAKVMMPSTMAQRMVLVAAAGLATRARCAGAVSRTAGCRLGPVARAGVRTLGSPRRRRENGRLDLVGSGPAGHVGSDCFRPGRRCGAGLGREMSAAQEQVNENEEWWDLRRGFYFQAEQLFQTTDPDTTDPS